MKEPFDISKAQKEQDKIPSIIDEVQKYAHHLAQLKVPFIFIIPLEEGMFMTSSIVGDVRVGVLDRVKHMCVQEMMKHPLEVKNIPNPPEGTC